MNTSLEIVVVAIILLVVALVLLTIFGTGMTPFGAFTSNKNVCIQQYDSSCKATGNDPVDWGVAKYKDSKGVLQACSTLAKCSCINNVASCT
ncbi:MAG: hypothetical protein NTU57_05230 [Candidatus Aenigmarchaeota archaeon]|nr:hypothetical protein [Candidatus Aenigmarchaeota archaeon]